MQSLNRLGCDYLDLYLIHWPDSSLDMSETLRGFKALRDEGLIRHSGVSNFTQAHLDEFLPLCMEAGVDVVNNQIELHPFLYHAHLLDYCRGKDLSVTAYCPLARGRVVDYGLLKEVGTKYNKSASQVSLRWLLQKGVAAIPKTSSQNHLVENLEVFDFTLSDEDVKRIDGIAEEERVVNPPFAEF